MDKIPYQKMLEIKEKVDILIIGGSQSGVAAAVSAKRAYPKATVMIIEQFGYLGGQSIGTMVVHYEQREYTNNYGQVIARGIGREIIERTVKKGHSDPLYQDWLNGQGPPYNNVKDQRAVGDITLDLEDLKLTLQEICDEAGVVVKLFTRCVDVITNNRNPSLITPEYIIASNSDGLFGIQAQIIVDCSGNNDIAWFIGEEHIQKTTQDVMPMQTYVWLAGIDCEKFIESVWANINCWNSTTVLYPNDKAQMIDHMKTGKAIMMRGGADYIDEAETKYPGILTELERYCVPMIYFWLKTIKINPVQIKNDIIYDSIWAIEGPFSFQDQTDPNAVSTFQQKQLYAAHILQKIHSVLPGWEKCYLARTSDRMGFRQTRVLKGLYAMTEHDIKDAVQFPDVIGRGGGHDISRRNIKWEIGYDIPFRALVPAKIDNLLVGARSISCDVTEKGLTALNAHRGIQATIVCSQAAGVAAALCIKNKTSPHQMDIKELQTVLQSQDVIIKKP